MKATSVLTVSILAAVAMAAGCAADDERKDAPPANVPPASAPPATSNPPAEPPNAVRGTSKLGTIEVEREPIDGITKTGKFLFERETFDGNGRSCMSCHTKDTGTITPKQLQDLYAQDPNGPMFRSLDSDDGVGNSYTRLLSTATVRVTLTLPPTVKIAELPNATSITVARGTPSTIDTPALDKVLMSDGRAPTLTFQAGDAIKGHAQPGRTPTANELQLIADYERTDSFFSSSLTRNWAAGGAAPGLPAGNTDSEKRGRAFFETDGRCGICHTGPLLNETFHDFTIPDGTRFESALVGFVEADLNPEYTFVVEVPPEGVFSPSIFADVKPDYCDSGKCFARLKARDPGRMLITGKAEDYLNFKIPSLRGISKTGPYFHNNSAATLEDVVDHYNRFFEFFQLPAFTDQEKIDVVNFMKSL